MKKKLLSLMTWSLVLMCSVSIAQPTLTATGMNPVIGNSYTVESANYVSPGSSGASQTWNLSSMSGTSSSTANAVSPGSTTYGGSFPNSNLAWTNTGGDAIYYKTSNTALQFYGVASGTTVLSYSNPEDQLHFPFTYNNTYSDTWAVNFNSGGYTVYRKGTTNVTADSYGTLVTPAGTFTNVLRIHFVQNYQDSIYVMGPQIVTYNNDEYIWYKEGTHVQLATVYTLTPSTGSPTTSGTYTTTTSGINEFSGILSSSDLFPNPASDKVTIDFSLTENQKVNVRLINVIGEQLNINQNTNGVQGENRIQLDVADLSEGIYFAQIVLNGNIAATKRFVISK